MNSGNADLFAQIRRHISVERLCGATGQSSVVIEALFDKIHSLLEIPDERKGEEVVLYIDGAARSNPGPAGIGVVIVGPEGNPVAEYSEHIGETTNNVAEYRALQLALTKALASGARSVLVKTDSELLVKQMQGKYRVKNRGIIPHFQACKELASGLVSFRTEHVPRAENKRADVLANNAIDAALAKAG